MNNRCGGMGVRALGKDRVRVLAARVSICITSTAPIVLLLRSTLGAGAILDRVVVKRISPKGSTLLACIYLYADYRSLGGMQLLLPTLLHGQITTIWCQIAQIAAVFRYIAIQITARLQSAALYCPGLGIDIYIKRWYVYAILAIPWC